MLCLDLGFVISSKLVYWLKLFQISFNRSLEAFSLSVLNFAVNQSSNFVLLLIESMSRESDLGQLVHGCPLILGAWMNRWRGLPIVEMYAAVAMGRAF
jgi:hypothetical protein